MEPADILLRLSAVETAVNDLRKIMGDVVERLKVLDGQDRQKVPAARRDILLDGGLSSAFLAPKIKEVATPVGIGVTGYAVIIVLAFVLGLLAGVEGVKR